MAAPAFIVAAKAAAAVLSDKRTRKALGWLIVIILSPILFVIAVIMGILGGGASHNNAAVQYAFHGGTLPAEAPQEYRDYMNSMRDCFSGLDAAIAEIDAIAEDRNLNAERIKAVFYTTHFGNADPRYDADYYRSFAQNFADFEEREREITVIDEDGEVTLITETYSVAIPLTNPAEMYGRFGLSADEQANAQQTYNTMLYGDNIVTDDFDENGYWTPPLIDTEVQYLGDGSETQVVYYHQADARWGAELYGQTGTIASAGCGPTAMAMVVSTLSGNTVTPPEMAAWSCENGYRVEGNGSSHGLIPNSARHFGLTVEGASYTEGQKIVDALSAGKLVVAVMSRGHFTSGGHFIILRGITAEGEILVADPVSMSRSKQAWPLSIILGEARRDAGAGGPFWICSAP